jgi:hypothetical protein
MHRPFAESRHFLRSRELSSSQLDLGLVRRRRFDCDIRQLNATFTGAIEPTASLRIKGDVRVLSYPSAVMTLATLSLTDDARFTLQPDLSVVATQLSSAVPTNTSITLSGYVKCLLLLQTASVECRHMNACFVFRE